ALPLPRRRHDRGPGRPFRMEAGTRRKVGQPATQPVSAEAIQRMVCPLRRRGVLSPRTDQPFIIFIDILAGACACILQLCGLCDWLSREDGFFSPLVTCPFTSFA